MTLLAFFSSLQGVHSSFLTFSIFKQNVFPDWLGKCGQILDSLLKIRKTFAYISVFAV